MPTSPDDLVATYLRALTTADAELAVSLFSADGVVHSPLYGSRPAADFYPALLADTSQANLTLKSAMSGEDQTGAMTVSFWFRFDWRLPSGAAAPFDVVDVATLASDGKIQDLHILYDTVDVRPASRLTSDDRRGVSRSHRRHRKNCRERSSSTRTCVAPGSSGLTFRTS